MVRTARKNATSTIFAEQQELNNDLFSGMLWWKTMPPGEAANVEKFCAVEENIGPTDPGDFVAYDLSRRDQALFQV